MRIGIDASWAAGARTGTGMYTLNLVRALLATDKKNEYVLYFRRTCVADNPLFALQGPRVSCRVVDARLNVWRMGVSLSIAAWRDRLDLFYSPAFFLPLFLHIPALVTFFDANIFLMGDMWKRKGHRLSYYAMRTLLPVSLRKARHIVTISESAKEDLVRLFPEIRDRVTVLYPIVDGHRFEARDDAVTLPEDPYFVYAGYMSPTKNIEGMIRAFALLKKELPHPCKLILIGKDPGGYVSGTMLPLARELGVINDVVCKGYVTDAVLGEWIRGAQALLLPSFIEGFGYPIVEAMQLGVPVITSSISACAEVAGDAALLVNPYESATLVSAMQQILDDPVLRGELVRKGASRATAFSGDGIAQQFLDLFDRHGRLPDSINSNHE
jgi:glycosyltransferase involved in cell wall biosynthesis